MTPTATSVVRVSHRWLRLCDNDLGVKNIQSYQAQEECVEATVTDCQNNPVQGVKVDFTVQGTNTATWIWFYQCPGKSSVLLYRFQSGIWIPLLPMYLERRIPYTIPFLPTSLSINPTMTATWSARATNNCVTATVVDGNNLAVPNAQVIFMSTNRKFQRGESNAVFTNASGQAVMCYTATNTGKDTIKVNPPVV